MIAGIPDLRAFEVDWLDYRDDRAEAQRLAERFTTADVGGIEALVTHVLSERKWAEELLQIRTRQILEAPARLVSEIDGWLADGTGSGPFLDLGCGPGMLLAAACDRGRTGIGIDASLVWLVVADRIIRAHGGQTVLAAALGEALPLPDGSMGGVVSLDVIEHVDDPGAYLAEIDRVIRAGGHIALSTPNRFSPGAEPHVGVWGVGWLPRRWQRRYAEWRSGVGYASTELKSLCELGRLMRAHTNIDHRITMPAIPETEIEHFPTYRIALARAYNALTRSAVARALLRPLSPFYRIVGTRRA